jgi:ferrochelatase
VSAIRRKVAVVLFNLGGPDGPRAVRPFLENLFSDPAIIGAPTFIRRPLAALISRLREKSAIRNYALMGGASPLLPETIAQAEALEAELNERSSEYEFKTFIAMRYWGPSTQQAAHDVNNYQPYKVVLLPLYPQYSTATTGSSLAAWHSAYDGACQATCCWYDNEHFIEAHAQLIKATWEAAGKPRVRLLFSAHGLPKRIVAGGDPYQWQVENTCARVADRLGPGWDWTICYQSRVGPLKWIGPATPDVIRAAGADGIGLIVDPIAFVSEHIETLVELDRDYAELATTVGVPVYLRVPTVQVTPAFIHGLAVVVERSLSGDKIQADGIRCPAAFGRCPLNGVERVV